MIFISFTSFSEILCVIANIYRVLYFKHVIYDVTHKKNMKLRISIAPRVEQKL